MDSCVGCKFYVEESSGEIKARLNHNRWGEKNFYAGYCRRNPPFVLAVDSSFGPYGPRTTQVTGSTFAPVREIDWCGEFKKKEEENTQPQQPPTDWMQQG